MGGVKRLLQYDDKDTFLQRTEGDWNLSSRWRKVFCMDWKGGNVFWWAQISLWGTKQLQGKQEGKIIKGGEDHKGRARPWGISVGKGGGRIHLWSHTETAINSWGLGEAGDSKDARTYLETVLCQEPALHAEVLWAAPWRAGELAVLLSYEVEEDEKVCDILDKSHGRLQFHPCHSGMKGWNTQAGAFQHQARFAEGNHNYQVSPVTGLQPCRQGRYLPQPLWTWQASQLW